MSQATPVSHSGKIKGKFGIDRSWWRCLILVLFVLLAATGFFLSVAKGAITMSLSQV